MKRLAVDNAARWTLAAWTLLATTLASPTFAHSHSEGHLPHGHEQADRTAADLSQSFGLHNDHGGDHGASGLTAADFHQHRYLLLLGAVEYLPAPSEPSSSHQQSPCVWETVIDVSASQVLRACSTGPVVDQLQAASLGDRSADCICQPGQNENPASDSASSAPLCDRARHERSGVQLA